MPKQSDAGNVNDRIELMTGWADREEFPLPYLVAKYLAITVRGNARDLEGTLIRLIAIASLTDREITLELARETLEATQDEVLH